MMIYFVQLFLLPTLVLSQEIRAGGNTDAAFGGVSNLPVSSPLVADLAWKAVAQLEQNINAPSKLTLVRVTNAQQQLVAGTRYLLEYVVGETDCPPNPGVTGPNDNCPLNPNKSFKRCEVEVLHQTWQNLERIETKACHDISKDDALPGKTGTGTAAAAATADSDQITIGVPGGLSESVDKRLAADLARKGIARVEAETNANYRLRLVRVTNAHSQVVAGTKYSIEYIAGETTCSRTDIQVTDDSCNLNVDGTFQKCTVEIWQKLWENFEQVTNKGCSDVSKAEAVPVDSAIGGVPEALTNLDNKTLANELATKSVIHLEKEVNAVLHLTLVRILKAQSRVAAGAKYEVEYIVGETNCSITTQRNSSDCSLKEDGVFQKCTAEVWRNASDNASEQITNKGCITVPRDLAFLPKLGGSQFRAGFPFSTGDEITSIPVQLGFSGNPVQSTTIGAGANIPGNILELSSSGELARRLAAKGMAKLKEETKSAYHLVLVRVTKLETLISNGTSYYLQYITGESNCSADVKPTPELPCDKWSRNGTFQRCKLEIWQKDNSEQLTTKGCSEISKEEAFLNIEDSGAVADAQDPIDQSGRGIFSTGEAVSVASLFGPSPGSVIDLDPSSTLAVQLGVKGVSAVEAASRTNFNSTLIKVIKAQSLVAQGVHYLVDFVTGQTSCKNQTDADSEECDLKLNGAFQRCQVEIWHKFTSATPNPSKPDSEQVTPRNCIRINRFQAFGCA